MKILSELPSQDRKANDMAKTQLQLIRDVFFHRRLEELRRAYRMARAEIDRDKQSHIQWWNDYVAKVERGEASFTEEDEDGYPTFDASDYAGEMIAECEGILNLVRRAFTVSLHHLWEREVSHRLKLTFERDRVFAALKSEGYLVDEDGLTQLHLAANVMKHGAGGSANALYDRWPEMFDIAEMQRIKDPPPPPSEEFLMISDETLERFFAAVSASWPRGQKL